MTHTNQKDRVLVVDDDKKVLELVVDVLANDSIIIDTASSGTEAIALAKTFNPNMLVTDLLLGDCNGMDVIDEIRNDVITDLPAIVITGQDDPKVFSEISRRRPIELLTKPLNIDRLQGAVSKELARQSDTRSLDRRNERLKKVVGILKTRNVDDKQQVHNTCTSLTAAYRSLSGQLAMQQRVLDFQKTLLGARTDDDVFAALFQLYVKRTGPVFGIAMVCDSTAQLRIIGRFGVPHPDSLQYCQMLSEPIIDILLTNPQCVLIDAYEQSDIFDQALCKYLAGVTILAVPLVPTPGEMIGMCLFYRKGEQPFTPEDVALAEMALHPTAVAIRRND